MLNYVVLNGFLSLEDIVYIGAIHPKHLPVGKAALDAGKPVLCEKPLCVNVRETKELLEHARSKNLFLMEALWVRFFPAYQKLRELLNSKVIGDVTNVVITFGVPLGEIERFKNREIGGGATIDIGIYCVQFALFVFGEENPVEILSTGTLNSSGADDGTSVSLKFSGGGLVTFTTSYKCTMPNEAFVIGTNGTIKVTVILLPITQASSSSLLASYTARLNMHSENSQVHTNFWSATKLELFPSGDVFHYPVPAATKPLNFWDTTGLAYQCHEVRKCLMQGNFFSCFSKRVS